MQGRDIVDSLNLQLAVIHYLARPAERDTLGQHIQKAPQNANPHFLSEAFKKIVEKELKSPEFQGGWSSFILVCRATPVHERWIKMAGQFLQQMKKLKVSTPEIYLEGMLKQIQLTDDFYLYGLFYFEFSKYLSSSFKQRVGDIVFGVKDKIIEDLFAKKYIDAMEFICKEYRINPVVIIFPQLLKKLTQLDLESNHPDVERFWLLVKHFPAQMNQYFLELRSGIIQKFEMAQNNFRDKNVKFLQDKKEFTKKDADEYFSKRSQDHVKLHSSSGPATGDNNSEFKEGGLSLQAL